MTEAYFTNTNVQEAMPVEMTFYPSLPEEIKSVEGDWDKEVRPEEWLGVC